MKRRKLNTIMIGLLGGVTLGYPQMSRESLAADYAFGYVGMPKDWVNPTIKANFDTFMVSKTNIKKDSSNLKISIYASLDKDNLQLSDSKTIENIEINDKPKDISSKINSLNITNSDAVDISSIDLDNRDKIKLYTQIKLEYDSVTHKTDINSATIDIVASSLKTEEYKYEDIDRSGDNWPTVDVSDINRTVKVVLEGTKGGSNGGYSEGGNGGYSEAEIDLSKYNVLTIAPGQQGGNGGDGINSGGSGKWGGGRGGGSTEILNNGTRLVQAGGGGGGGNNKHCASAGGGAPGGRKTGNAGICRGSGSHGQSNGSEGPNETGGNGNLSGGEDGGAAINENEHVNLLSKEKGGSLSPNGVIRLFTR